jgi:inosine-uridine nucleoside N-ribohydrolase
MTGRLAAALVAVLLAVTSISAQEAPASAAREKVILDTDIGDDIDDAFALALILSSPEFELLGVTTAWGNTQLRARLVERLLCETGMEKIPVFAGISTQTNTPLDAAAWAKEFPQPPQPYPRALDFVLGQIRRYPNQITLFAIAPLTNVGALIERDPEAFRKLKRVVMMGGSIRRGYGDLGYTHDHGPDPEYNIKSDVASAQKLLASGVPLFIMPLDSTQLKLDEVKRQLIFQLGTPLTDALTLLYHHWGQLTPTLFDPPAVAFAIKPEICPTQPMRIEIDEKGYTRPGTGPANAQVCLDSKSDQFFQLYMTRILSQRLTGHCSR